MSALSKLAWTVAAGTAVFVGAGQASAAIIYNGGAPNQYSVYFADQTYPYTEDGVPFTLTSGASTVTDVHWWGGCAYGGTCPTGDFTVNFYNDSSGSPGSLIQSYAVGNAGQTLTGLLIQGEFNEYSYNVTIPALALTAGTPYWLGISNDTGTSTIWGMETTNPVTGGSHYQRLDGSWTLQSNNLAFYLTNGSSSVPEPASLTLLGVGLGGSLLLRRRRIRNR